MNKAFTKESDDDGDFVDEPLPSLHPQCVAELRWWRRVARIDRFLLQFGHERDRKGREDEHQSREEQEQVNHARGWYHDSLAEGRCSQYLLS